MQDRKIIAYASRQLRILDRDCPIHDLKLVVIAFTLKIRRYYVY